MPLNRCYYFTLWIWIYFYSYETNIILGSYFGWVKGEVDEDGDFDFNETFPWYYIPCQTGSSKIIMYFHGNGEDLGLWADILREIVRVMKWHAIAVEYPGYGVCFEQK